MSKRYLFVAILGMFLLSNCSTSKKFAKYDNIMSEWKSESEDNLYIVYGPPMRSQVLSDNKKIVVYHFSTVEGRFGNTNTWECELKFILENGIVTTASYSGNFGGVKKYVKGPDL